MALVCPSCGTENRLAARFCIECVSPLPVDFAPTQQLPLRAGKPSSDELPEALAAFAGGPSSAPAAPLPETAFQVPTTGAATKPVGKVRAFLVLSGGFALAAAAGWFVASSDGDAGTNESAAAQSKAVVPMAAAAPMSEAAPLPTSALPVAAVSTQPLEAAGGSSRAADDKVPLSQPAATTATRASAAKPVVQPERAAHSSPARGSAGLLSSCESLGYFARARCEVEVCSNPSNTSRRECAPIREQQRLVEQKRNPQLAN